MKKTQKTSGQALITMLYIMVIGVLVTTGAVYALFVNTSVSSTDELGLLARTAAESGIENALLRRIRDPNYAGESFTMSGNRFVTVTVTNGTPVHITATGTVAGVSRKVMAEIQYVQGILNIISWKEIP